MSRRDVKLLMTHIDLDRTEVLYTQIEALKKRLYSLHDPYNYDAHRDLHGELERLMSLYIHLQWKAEQ